MTNKDYSYYNFNESENVETEETLIDKWLMDNLTRNISNSKTEKNSDVYNILTNSKYNNTMAISNISSYYNDACASYRASVSMSEDEYRRLINLNNAFVQYLSEDSIRNIINEILKSPIDELSIRDIIREIVSNRHFSEDFLLEFFQYLDKASIMAHHKSEVISGRYASIMLALKI